MEPSAPETEILPLRHLAGILAEMEKLLQSLLHDPHSSQGEFLCGGLRFGQVYAMAGTLYRAFMECGEQDNEGVSICLAAEDRGVIAAAILAALASNTVLSLPHNLSHAALRQMRQTTRFDYAVTDRERDLPDGVMPLTCGPDDDTISLPTDVVHPDATLLQLFTGGSTGSPRIWAKTAANIFSEARFLANTYGITAADTILATVSPSHIYGLLFSVVIPLLVGCRVLPESPSFPAEILDCAQREAATILVSVPPHYRVLKGRSFPTSLRLAVSSAGMLPEEDNSGFCGANRTGIVEIYGSTETGGIARRNRSCGEEFFTPLSPIVWKIEDKRLLLQSPFLSPDLPRDSAGFFLSGDRVQQEGTESFALLGRADSVTKVAGVRVDLDEVQELLQKQAGVKECVVMAMEDKTGRGKRIAALLRGDGLDPGHIRRALAAVLDPAALPKRIVVVPTIPVIGTGKYDRAAIEAILSGKSNSA